MANMTPSSSYIYFPEDDQEIDVFFKQIMPHIKELLGKERKFSITLQILDNVTTTQELNKIMTEALKEADAIDKRELVPYSVDKADGKMLFKLKG